MPVILDFGTFGHGEAQTAENLDDFVAHKRQRVARAQSRGRCGTAQVKTFVERVDALGGAFQSRNFLRGKGFELIDFNAHLLFLIGGDVAEIGHEGVRLAFFGEIFDAQSLHLLR